MAGGPGKIEEYNRSISPAELKANQRKGGKKSGEARKAKSDIRAIAKMINNAPAGAAIKDALAMLNIEDGDMTNAAGIAMAVFQAAIDGDMKAVEKWEKYVGQAEQADAGAEVQIIDDL